MVENYIQAEEGTKRLARDDGSPLIKVSELFYSIQGENFVGFPAVFLRLSGCVLDCQWCDSKEQWKHNENYSAWELCELFNKEGIHQHLKDGAHLVITGGSPLIQQKAILEFLDIFQEMFRFKPLVEIENECVIPAMPEMLDEYVNLWNNSPKLANSGIKKDIRYKPEVIKQFTEKDNAFFKFVVSSPEDWDEIKSDYIDTGLVKKEQIVLMPEAVTKEELEQKREWLIHLCLDECVRFSDRLHITVWSNKRGV